MYVEKKRTIVSSTISLNNYPILHIDEPSLELFRQNFPVSKSGKLDYRRILTNLLDCYLGVTRQSITYTSLSEKSINKVFAGFVGAMWDKSFVQYNEITTRSCVKAFCEGLRAISEVIPSIKFDIDINTARKVWNSLETCEFKIEYYTGWRVSGKGEVNGRNLRLAWVWNYISADIARKIHKSAKDYVVRYEKLENHVPLLNGLCGYIESQHPKISENDLNNPQFITRLIEGYCKFYFKRYSEENNCINTAIKRWNDALDFMEATLVKSGAFARPFRSFPYIPPNRKAGSETRVDINENGVAVKESLITKMPLQMTDDEIVDILFNKINEDVDTVIEWAREQVSSLTERANDNSGRFDYKDFSLTTKELASKYKINRKRGEKTSEFAFQIGLPTSYSLEPFAYLLINEHPKITEAFLFGLELYDKHDRLTGFEYSDAGVYLVGYKRRRGGANAQQKIKLNDKSIALVEQVVKLTEPLREFLKYKNDDNYRYLFLSCGTGFAYPIRVKESLRQTRGNSALEYRISQFMEIRTDWSEQQAYELVSRLSPSKFRTTRGVQVYIETGSAKEMSEALGHAKYKPELLSYYLPMPILRFFQSRWIRLFQKGIICEAMKNSAMLLRASNFESINELDVFLTNHALKLPRDLGGCDVNEAGGVSQMYISVDENILTALLSIELAVKSTTRKITPKAKYWAKFSELIKIEIEKNSYDRDMISSLENAKRNLDVSLVEGLIYA